jgi:hypothetical protein
MRSENRLETESTGGKKNLQIITENSKSNIGMARDNLTQDRAL